MIYQNSRLSRKSDQQNKKQTTYMLVGIVVILFLVFTFGLQVITGISDFFIALNERNSASTQSNDPFESYLQAPILDVIPTATNSSSIIISGRSAENKGKVEISLNDSRTFETELFEDGGFSERVSGLREGENIIKARFVSEDDKNSEYTREHRVSFSKKGPDLELASPSDGASFTKGDQITVNGKTSPDSNVTVNGFRAIVDGDGNYSYYLKLKEGDNEIKVEAENTAGLKTTKTIKVTYRP